MSTALVHAAPFWWLAGQSVAGGVTVGRWLRHCHMAGPFHLVGMTRAMVRVGGAA